MSVRVRFAPSPTGQVHIGNIRAAIFNWLFARHEKGTFLLRIEDTDLERSTPEAIKTLLEVMEWLGLDFDEKPPLYQTSQVSKHLAAVQKLLDQGDAYKDAKGGGGEAVLFKIPWHAENVPGVHEVGPAEIAVHPETPVVISYKGVDYAALSSKGKAAPGGGALAGFKDLQVLDAEDKVLFDIHGQEEAILSGDLVQTLEGAAKLRFTRRAITYHDLVKGDMTKPLDGMKDVVIVRSDGSPVFHIANVVDDITQKVTHIIRGDDHVENTFRHIMMFSCLGAPVPQYGHLPMIVNAAGKPYSKRDGDAFVGDFKDKGFLADTMVNYLALLGWNPGDEREKMSREELIEAFSLDRCQHTPAQMDIQKMTNLNGQYLAEMEIGKFTEMCKSYLAVYDWGQNIQPEYLTKVCTLMQSRLKKFADVEQWKYFFVETPDYDEKNLAKQFKDDSVKAALKELESALAGCDFTAAAIEAAIHATTEKLGMGQGKLNQPLRAAVTGVGVGAGIYETLELLGKELSMARLDAFFKR